MELVCPAGSLPALKAAVDNGADWVYLGLRDNTNARNFAGLNFDGDALAQGLAYAHARKRRVVMTVNTYPQPASWQRWPQGLRVAQVASRQGPAGGSSPSRGPLVRAPQ